MAMWFKCYIKIDSKGIPLEKKGYVEPIYIQTNEATYSVVSENELGNNFAPEMIDPSFSGLILQNCSENSRIKKIRGRRGGK